MHQIRRIASRINKEHLQILQSLEKGDLNEARTVIRGHITRLKAIDFTLEIPR
jgi:DNA-binding GntR family transcriptional regulator